MGMVIALAWSTSRRSCRSWEPLILMGEREISNHSSHESLSGARYGHFAGHGGAPGRETNVTGGVREISNGKCWRIAGSA